MDIYKKLSPKWKNFHEQQVFLFRIYILCENFSKIRPIINKIPKFSDDPLKVFVKLLLHDVKLFSSDDDDANVFIISSDSGPIQ